MSELPEVDPRPSKLEKGSYDDVLVIPQSLANQVEAQQEYISKNRKVSIEDTRSSKVCFRYQVRAELAVNCRCSMVKLMLATGSRVRVVLPCLR